MGDRMDIPLPDSNYELDIVLVGINHPWQLGCDLQDNVEPWIR